ncbi:RNA polymerase sigma factor [Oscillospiraceae bacterium 50-60]
MLICYLQMLDTPEEKIRFEQIYQKYRGLMYHVADTILHNRQDAEDAVHNAFLQIIKHFKKFQNTSIDDLTPQIVVVAKNEAISLRRKKKDEAPLEEGENLIAESETVTDYHALVDSFTRLPQIYRAVMEMKLLLGYSDGEIAARLGLTKTAVSSRINRGRLLLRDIVEQEGFLRDA